MQLGSGRQLQQPEGVIFLGHDLGQRAPYCGIINPRTAHASVQDGKLCMRRSDGFFFLNEWILFLGNVNEGDKKNS